MNRRRDICPEILALFPDVEAGLLPAERIEPHLGACPSCRGAWEDFLRAVGEAPASLPADPPGAEPGYWANFLPRLRGRIETEGSRRTAGAGRAAWIVPAAAALVLGFCLGAGVTAFVRLETAPRPRIAETVSSEGGSQIEHAETWQEGLLLPLPDDSPWEEPLYEALLEELGEDDRLLLEADLLEEIS